MFCRPPTLFSKKNLPLLGSTAAVTLGIILDNTTDVTKSLTGPLYALYYFILAGMGGFFGLAIKNCLTPNPTGLEEVLLEPVRPTFI